MNRVRIISVIIIGYFVLTASSCPRTQCPTEANIFVGVDPDKPSQGKIALICPGESAGIGWFTESAETASITPDLGDVAIEGLEIVSPVETTTYTLTATGSQCSDEDEVGVRIIKDGDTIGLTLNEPPTDKETGFPVDLIWRGAVDSAFVSNSIRVTRVAITTAGDWPTWNFQHTGVTGPPNAFSASLTQAASIATPFQLSGNYESTPTGVTAPVAIADFPVGLELTLTCSQ